MSRKYQNRKSDRNWIFRDASEWSTSRRVWAGGTARVRAKARVAKASRPLHCARGENHKRGAAGSHPPFFPLISPFHSFFLHLFHFHFSLPTSTPPLMSFHSLLFILHQFHFRPTIFRSENSSGLPEASSTHWYHFNLLFLLFLQLSILRIYAWWWV